MTALKVSVDSPMPGQFLASDGTTFVNTYGPGIGNVYYVDSNATGAANDTSHGGSRSRPFATLDYAIGRCTANNGDQIHLMPGHAEDIGSATACVFDVAGVTVIGHGKGLLRPTLSITAAAGTISITAANVWIENVLVVGNFLNIVTAFTVAGTADGLTIKNVETRDTSAVKGALIQFSLATGLTDVTFDGYVHRNGTTLTAPATNVILAAGTYDRLTMVNCDIQCFTTAAAVGLSAGAGKDCLFLNNRLIQYETGAGLGYALHNSSTGFVDNFVGINLKNTVKAFTGTGVAVGPNVVYSNAVNAYAGLFNYTVDS